jgi:hypothetical protein
VQPGPPQTRFYTVRPPKLADALVAERAFTVPVPVIDLSGLASRWPQRTGQLAQAAIRSALLGAVDARPLAAVLLESALGSDTVADDAKTDLCLDFIRLDRQAAERVLALARETLDLVMANGGTSGWEIEPAVRLAGRAAWLHQLDLAIDLLLDASLADPRPQNSHPGHPIRQIEDLVRNFHPEVPRQLGIRQQIARRASRWLARAPDDRSRCQVTAKVMQITLSLGIQSGLLSPGKPHELSLIDTIIPAQEVHQVFQEIWPVLEAMLSRGCPELANAAIDTATEWLRIGAGYDHPFGQDHPADRCEAAHEIGEALIGALALRGDLSDGSRARLRSAAARFGATVTVELPGEVSAFFADVETRGTNWLDAEAGLVAEIRALMNGWATDDPARTMARLAQIKADLAQGWSQWPNRTMIAAIRLAEIVADQGAWLQAASDTGFMPEGCRFAERLIQAGALSEEVTRPLLADPVSRAEILEVLIAAEPAPDWAAGMASGTLTIDDYRLLEWLMLRRQLSVVWQETLLASPDPELRAAAAVAIFNGGRKREGWKLGALRPAWLAALGSLQPTCIPGCPGYEMAELFKYLTGTNPDALTSIISRSLLSAGEGGAYGSLPHECWDIIHLLPGPAKLKLRRQFQHKPVRRWILDTHLLGPDTEWLEELLSSDEISPDEALSFYGGLQDGDLPIETLAKLLVPRGIDPARIAMLRLRGGWSGSMSSWYQAIVDSFEKLSDDKDPSVQAVAAAGIQIFTAERDQAAHAERTQRIRGST